MALRLRQGLAADRTSITPASGELIYTTDTKYVYVGDGSTAGGNLITGAVPTNLDGLSDVVITAASNGQIIKYNGTNWVNAAETGGATNLDGLTDVVITAPSNGQVLKYNGTNWVNGTDATGGGSTSFLVSGDDSSTITINGGDTLSILGNSQTNVYFDEFNNLTIDTPSQIAAGVAGQIAFYANSGNELQGTGAGLLYDNATGTVFTSTLDVNQITSPFSDFAIFPQGTNPTVSLGGTHDGTEYTGKLLTFDFGPFDPAAPFTTIFSQIHNDNFVNAVQFQRARGTLAVPTTITAGDFLGSIFFVGYDGANYKRSASISSYAPTTVSSNIVPGALAFETMNDSGTETVAAIIDYQQYFNFYGAYRYALFVVATGASNAVLTRGQIRGNMLVTTPTGGTRTVTLPAPDNFLYGLELVIINASVTQSLNINYTGFGGTVTTLVASTAKKVVCDGTIWFAL